MYEFDQEIELSLTINYQGEILHGKLIKFNPTILERNIITPEMAEKIIRYVKYINKPIKLIHTIKIFEKYYVFFVDVAFYNSWKIELNVKTYLDE